MGFCSTRHILYGWNLRCFRKIAHTDSRLFINSHACLLAERLGLRMSASLAVFRCPYSFIKAKMLFLNNTSCWSRVWTHLKIVFRPGTASWSPRLKWVWKQRRSTPTDSPWRTNASYANIGCSSVYCSMSTKITLYIWNSVTLISPSQRLGSGCACIDSSKIFWFLVVTQYFCTGCMYTIE